MDVTQIENEELGEEEQLIEEDYGASFPADIIELEHSFGYDCKRLFNLVLADEDTLIFASGNYLHYFSISRREVTFRETTFGCGIGFITKNEQPAHSHLFTVGENGPTPTVFIYEYPSHNIRCRLLNAAKACFTAGSYNSTGELFASQAGYPDFMLTIWRWETEEVVLRSKSFQSDILFVHFSHFNPILLVSSGVSHIKFWKMANTFTGLKLKGDLGRFGKTDFSDIYATYMLPDENVISGCDWGNMLLWEAGLIKFEICRKGRKPCHLAPITRITMKNGEVTTYGMDGYVRVWFWETVDLADPPEDDLFVEIDPIYEFKIENVEIRAMQKINLLNEHDFTYYAQDGKGGIWFCDINMYDIPKKAERLYSCTGGRVIAAETSPVSPHLLTLSEDGKIFAYNYSTQKLLLEKHFVAKGVDLLWFSSNVAPSGMELIAGFEDGIIRQLYFEPNAKKPRLHQVRALKGHTAPVTKLSVNDANTLLVSGSADKSIFVYSLLHKSEGLIDLQPIGFIEFKAIPNCFYWHGDAPNTVLVGCKTGEVYEYNLRVDVTDEETYLSYNLSSVERLLATSFVSVKSRIRRDLHRAMVKRRKERKRKRKIKEIEKLKKTNPGLQIDMESALVDSEPEEEEEPLHIPAVPNPVLWLKYTERNTIWVSMGGYDAGYIYELEFGAPEPSICTMIADGDDIEIHSYLLIDEYLIFGLVNGCLRINRLNIENFTDLADYRLYPMHESPRGTMPRLLATYDGHHIISVGYDGNIFLYKWHGPIVEKNKLMEKFPPLPAIELGEDIVELDYPSLEQEKINAELRRQEEAAAAHDRDVLEKIGELQIEYQKIIQYNEGLPPELRLADRDLLFDERITMQIRNELQAELDDVREDLAYDLEFAQVGHTKLYNHFLKELVHVPFCIYALRSDDVLYSFRLQALGEEHEQIKRDIEERLRREQEMGLKDLVYAEEEEDSIGEVAIESFFFGRDPRSILPRFSKKMMRLLLRYRNRQLYELRRVFDWDKLERQKPDPNRNHPDDDAKILEAQRNLGDYKLKIGDDYEPKLTDTLTQKYIELVNCRERFCELVNSFNDELLAMRDRKKALWDYIGKMRARLDAIRGMLPEGCHQTLGEIRGFDMDLEYPDLNLIEHYQPGCGIEIDDILYLEKTVETLMAEKRASMSKSTTFEPRHKKHSNEEEKSRTLRITECETLPTWDELVEIIESLPQATDVAYYEIDSDGKSPLFIESRFRWLLKLVVEQENIISEIDALVRNFDTDLNKLLRKRNEIKLQSEFMTTYMISLNQELYILRDSEEIEMQLLLNANVAMNTRNELQVVINATNRQLEELKKNIDKLQEQITTLQAKFAITIKGHKFYDFLRRIFKKKWKPPKPPHAEDESSESSSSDSSSSEDEEADTKSIDSLDVTNIRLDESTCPSGLERPMYELAFKMRSDRHELERAIIESQRDVESKRKEIIQMQDKMKFHEAIYEQERKTLIDFRRNRQRQINKVEMNAVLRMDQLQHFYPGDDYRDLSRAILFDADKLVDLRRRVDTLNDETLSTKRWHRINIVHLRRMNTDIKFMRYEITRLEEEIRQAMMKRFGLIINLDELEEEVLRRYVFDLESTAEDELRALEKELREKEWELAQCEEDYIKATQTNTDKNNILAVLMEERNSLLDILSVQEKNFDKWTKPRKFDVAVDVEKLRGIHRTQKQQIECLEREICALRLKSKPLQMEEIDDASKLQVTSELMPTDEPQVCPTMLNVDAYMLPPLPDDFIMERIQTVVQKSFHRFFGAHTTPEKVRHFALRAALYLGQAAYNFEGKMTDRIHECITEHLQTIVPKKYLIHMSSEDLRKLFNEVLTILDYERSDVNTEEVVGGIFEHAKDELCGKMSDVINNTHFMVTYMFKELIEVLPLEEFQSDEVLRMLVNVLEREPLVDPRSIGIEEIITSTVQHARDNLLDGITAVPVRRVLTALQKDLIKRRQYKQLPCSDTISSTSKKRPGIIF